MADNKNSTGFALTFAENVKRDSNLSTTKQLCFDSLGDFIEERERIKRALEANGVSSLKVDYSNFDQHVFFDSAVSKFDIAKKKILTQYPFNGSVEDIDAFFLTGSAYESYVFEQWPAHAGYAVFNGTNQYITASDYDNALYLGTSSFAVSVNINPYSESPSARIIVGMGNGSIAGADAHGWRLYLSSSVLPVLTFNIFSGSRTLELTASYSTYTGSFHNVAVLHDTNLHTASMYIDGTRVGWVTSSFLGTMESTPYTVCVGTGSADWSYMALYSGSMDEVRILLSASERFIQKNYDRPIFSEDYVGLYYKFNEGITGYTNVDPMVVDYSKNSIHGTFSNYTTACRVSGATMSEDLGDPILYSYHLDVVAFTSSVELSASAYDKRNNNLIFNLIPPGLLYEDENAEGLLQLFSLAMARFFDELKLYIDQVDNLRVTNYDDANETPDLFLPYLQRYFGWKTTEHFGDSEPGQFLFGEQVLSSGSLDVSLLEIRNQFWRRTLNNLPYLLKTKGKRYNLDAFFNVLGVNKENINIKEYGYLPGGSIEDTRIHKEKVVSLLGIGTGSIGSLSSSFVEVPGPFQSGSAGHYTVEVLAQLPFPSASYDTSIAKGGIWQLVDKPETRSVALLWNKSSTYDTTGQFILTGSDGQSFTSSFVEVFDGDMVHIAAGIGSGSYPFISVRTIDNDVIDFSASFVGSVVFSGAFTGSAYNMIIGANSGTLFANKTQGFFGEARFWNRQLSGSELDNHAYHFENIGVNNPLEFPHPLKGHWALNEEKIAATDQTLSNIVDLSRNNKTGTGRNFPAGQNPYQKFLYEYNYLSPSVDLKWTENKIRIRNKSELTISEIAHDTNEVSLEFNLVDALNRDITKIFATMDILNNAIGNPVNKYRDEYSDLEKLRRVYFQRLSDSVNFTNFFKLFEWFDKKLSDSIKQLLPARVTFIGGEQVVESHMLERPKYNYRYSVFHTPQEPGTAEISGVFTFAGDKQTSIEGNIYPGSISSSVSPQFVSMCGDGLERTDRCPNTFYKSKVSGDTNIDIQSSDCGINYRNEWTRRNDVIIQSSASNEYNNSFVVNDFDSTKDQEHYFDGFRRSLSYSQ